MNVLGADLATKSGLAVLDGVRFVYGEAFKPKGDTDAEIFHGFRGHFRALLISHDIQYVAIEQPLRSDLTRTLPNGSKEPMAQMATLLRLYGLFGHACEICCGLNIPFRDVNQGTWRAAFTGDGHADKDRSLAQAKILGYPVKSKDVAEAVGVAWWLNGQLGLGRAGELALGKASAAA